MSRRRRTNTSRSAVLAPTVESGRASSARLAPWAWRLGLGALAVVGGWLAWREFRPAPEVVAPVAGGSLDPELAALVSRNVEHARAHPKDARAHGTLALVYEANEMWHEAERSYASAIHLDPGEPLWRYHRAIALRQAGDSASALVLLRDVADELSSSAGVRQRLGAALLETGDVAGALTQFRSAIALAPERPEPYAELGAALLEQESFADAAAALQRALAKDPSYASAHYSLGLVYRALGRKDDAERELALGARATRRFLSDDALAVELGTYRVGYAGQFGRAVAFVDAGKPELAIPIFETLLAANPADVNVLVDLAGAHLKLDQNERACELLLRAKKLEPGAFAIWLNLALCLLALDRVDEAAEHADRAVELAPQLGQAHFARAQIRARRGDFEGAYASLLAALACDASAPETRAFLGEVCVRLERYPEARVHFEEAVRMQPANLPAQVSLSSVCISLDLLEEAQRALDAARKLAPGHPRVTALAERLAQARLR